MPSWKTALQTFVKEWKPRTEVIGAVVCGSYITGNSSKHSDLDVQILLNSSVSWCECGSLKICGVLIDYFARPFKKHCEEFAHDYQLRRRIDAHMFATGKILFDKTGELARLILHARKYMFKPYKEQSLTSVKVAQYNLWDMLDNLKEIFEADGEEFYLVYYVHLYQLFEHYARFLRFDSIHVHKLRRCLVNERDRRKYSIPKFPDETFLTSFAKAIKPKKRAIMMRGYGRLTNYVLNQMGGFNIGDSKIRTHA